MEGKKSDEVKKLQSTVSQEENDEKYRKLKRSNNRLKAYVVILIFTLVLACILVFILCCCNNEKQKVNDNPKDEIIDNNPQEKNEKENEEQNENQESEIENYYEDNEKLIASYHKNETITQKKIVEFINEYNLGGLHMDYNEISSFSNPTSGIELLAHLYIYNKPNREYENVTKEEMDNYFKTAYGVVPTKYNDITDGNEVMYYYRDGVFVYNEKHHGHGIPYLINFDDYHIVDYKEEGNIYTIKLILADYENMDGPFVNDEQGIDSGDENYIDYFHKNIDKYKSKSVYEYTLEKNDNSFILKAFKVIR